MRLSILVSAMCVLLCLPAFAQKEWSNWYFGRNAGMAFIGGGPIALTANTITTLEGCATISDREGNLLFYTDGVSVWSRTHELMPNGSFLGGDTSSTQSALIVAQPGSRTHYYVFTPSRAESTSLFGFRYSVVDLNAASGGGLGDIIQKNIMLLPTATEKVTAVRHLNGRDVWIITHEIKTDVFYAYLLTADGVQSNPVRSSVGTIYPQGIGYLKASPDGKRLAAAVDFSLFEIYNFNSATGKVSNAIAIPTSIPHLCYGVEFSPDGQLLYGSKAFETNDPFATAELWQYDLTAGTPDQIRQSVFTIASFSIADAPMGALQLGPDGRIYVARAESRYVSVIAEPNMRGAGCTFIDKGVDLAPSRCQYGLPNFHPAVAAPEFYYSNTCFGDSTYFSVAPDLLPVDSVFWDYGDPAVAPNDTTSNLQGAYIYRAPGTYTVMMAIRRNGIIETFARNITIAPPPNIDLGPDKALCAGATVVLKAGNEKFDSYLWSTGDTTESITITLNNSGTYWVRVSRDMCQVADTVALSLRSVPMTVSADTTICRNGSAQLAASSAENLTYQWEPADGLNNPAVQMPVARPATTTTYTVTGTSKEGCSTKATVTVTVSSPFPLNLGGNRTICAGNSAELNATTTGATYLWSTGETTPVISATKPGLYSVVVSVGSCSAIDAVEVIVITPDIAVIGEQVLCRGSSVQLRASGAVSYEWSPAESLDDPRAAAPIATPQTTTTYRVIGTTAGECRDTAYVTVVVQEAISVDLGPDSTLCAGTTIELRAPVANARYQWSTGDTTEAITVGTSGIYSLTITAGTCTGTDEIHIDVSTPAVTIETPKTAICFGDSVRLTAYGATSYHWAPSVGLSSSTNAAPMAAPTQTTVYTVTGTNDRGCTTTASVVIEVIDGVPVELSLPALSGAAGTSSFAIPLTANVGADDLPLILRNMRVEVRINASVFLPTTTASTPWTVARNGDDLVFTLAPGDIVLTQPHQVLTEFTGTLLVSTISTAPLRFGTTEHERCILASTHPGELHLEGCIITNRAIRLFTPPSIDIMPNPVSDEATLRIRAMEHGRARLTLHTVEGKIVQEQGTIITSDDQIVVLSVQAIPTGLYRITLTTTTGIQTAVLHVVH